jgi:hypothetical protein
MKAVVLKCSPSQEKKKKKATLERERGQKPLLWGRISSNLLLLSFLKLSSSLLFYFSQGATVIEFFLSSPGKDTFFLNLIRILVLTSPVWFGSCAPNGILSRGL